MKPPERQHVLDAPAIAVGHAGRELPTRLLRIVDIRVHPPGEHRLQTAAPVSRAWRVRANRFDVGGDPSGLVHRCPIPGLDRDGRRLARGRARRMSPTLTVSNQLERLLLCLVEVGNQGLRQSRHVRRGAVHAFDRKQVEIRGAHQTVLRVGIGRRHRQRFGRVVVGHEADTHIAERAIDAGFRQGDGTRGAARKIQLPPVRDLSAPPALGDRLQGDRDLEVAGPYGPWRRPARSFVGGERHQQAVAPHDREHGAVRSRERARLLGGRRGCRCTLLHTSSRESERTHRRQDCLSHEICCARVMQQR